jgi:hypothetical protein
LGRIRGKFLIWYAIKNNVGHIFAEFEFEAVKFPHPAMHGRTLVLSGECIVMYVDGQGIGIISSIEYLVFRYEIAYDANT